MDLNRDSFISEEIINYLQSSYQNIYSDTTIIQNYIRYKELLLKQETAKNDINSEEFSIKFTPEDQEELETLNRYFYGNSDGSSNGDGNNLAYTYLSTINTIKDLISKGDNSIKDVVFNLTALLDNPNMSDIAYKKYLNELIIPGILGTSEITSMKTSDTISINKTVVNKLSKEEQNSYRTRIIDDKLKRDALNAKIKVEKETTERKLLAAREQKELQKNRLKDTKNKEAKKLKTANEVELNEEQNKIFDKKKDDIYRDINLKIQKLDEIIKNEIYIDSIKKIVRGKKRPPQNNSKQKERREERREERRDEIEEREEEEREEEREEIEEEDDDDEIIDRKNELAKDPLNKNKLHKIADIIENTTPKDDREILSSSFEILKNNSLRAKKGGNNLPDILYDINDTNIQTTTLSHNTNKTDKLLLLYIRLYNFYINPLKEKLKELRPPNTSQYNFPEDILLLYNNFKKEYDEFIKQNKEILKTEEDIQKNKDALAKKNSQKKIAENSIEQSILDLFEQYENLAIKLKESEKIIIKKSMKGGASKKLYLDDIKKTLDDYLKNITDEDKKSKIVSLKSKVEKMQQKINTKDIYDTLITYLNIQSLQDNVNDAAAAAAGAADSDSLKLKANKKKESQSDINELFIAKAKIEALQVKIKAIEDYKDTEDLFIQLNTELIKAYNQFKKVRSDLSIPDTDNVINQNIQTLINYDTELKEIYDKFNEIKKILNSEIQDKSKNEISAKFKNINDLFKKLKTLKYLNKYKFYIDEIKNLLDEVKKLLDNFAKNDDNDDSNDNDDNDDMKKQLQEEITDLQEKLNKSKSENAEKTLKLNDINGKLDKLTTELDKIEQTISKLQVLLARQQTENGLIEEENTRKKQNERKKEESNGIKKELEKQIKINEKIIETTDKQIKGKQKRLNEITSSKEKAIKQQKIAADLESQREFIRDISNQLKEYLTLVDYLNKIIKSIGLIKKTLNELILSKLNAQIMKDKFKFIQKRYIKGLIDFYNFKIISDYTIKLNNIEKLKPQEKQDEKITDNINSRYDKIREEYKVAFYKELEDIIRITDYQKIAEIVIKFLNKLIEFLNKDDDIIEDRFDDYHIYLIINLIIILAELENKEKIEELFKIYFNLIGDSKKYATISAQLRSITLKKATTGGGYSNIIPQDIKENEKLLPIEKISDEFEFFLKQNIYESFIQIRPTTDGITKKKINTLIPVCDIEKYFLTRTELEPDIYINADLHTKVHMDLVSSTDLLSINNTLNNTLNKIINSKEIITFIFSNNKILDINFVNIENRKTVIKYFNENISELTLEYIVNNLKVNNEEYIRFVTTLYYIIIKLINEKQIKINDILRKDLVYLLYIIIYNYYHILIKINKEKNIFINYYNEYEPIITNINNLLTSLTKNFKSTSDIYIILQYLIKISNYMLISIHNEVDKHINKKLKETLFSTIVENDILLVSSVLQNNSSNFNKLAEYFLNYDDKNITITNIDIKNYFIKMNNYVKNKRINLKLLYSDSDITTIITTIRGDSNNTIFNILENISSVNSLFYYLLYLYIVINKDISINNLFAIDLKYIIYFLIFLEYPYIPHIDKYIQKKEYLKVENYLDYYLNDLTNIQSETEALLTKLKLKFTEYSYMHTIFDGIIKLFPIITTQFKTYVVSLYDLQNDKVTKILKKFNISVTGGNKVIKDNIIDIKHTYDLYYSTNTDDLIIELLDVLGTNENVIYFLLIINTSLTNFFEDLNQILIDFYNTDILLSYYYNENEIIYYIFINYIYKNYKSLLSLSSKDIIINIGKIKTKENYNEIYKKIDALFKNPEIISKLILFIKSHLEIPKTIIHPKKIKDVEYLLLFIYKYSKKDEKIIKGYDSFLTYIYLNLLNKFNITSKIKIDNLPTFNLYKFTNLRKNYNFELSSNQEQLCVKLMKDIKLLISIISDRYKYIEHKTTIKARNQFELNDEILDYLNIFGNDEIFRDYKQMPIMDLNILNKNLKIDIKNIKEPTKQDNIIYNILLLSTFLYKDNNKIPVEIYCKLVRHYFLIRNNKLLNDLTYGLIYLMNNRIVKIDIQRNLIKELSDFNIELSEIKKFVEPEDRKINIIELLEKLNFINYFKDNIELLMPLLFEFYNTDNKIQYTIQDLLSKQILAEKSQKLLMYGGNNIDVSDKSEKMDILVYDKSTSLINAILSTEIIDVLEKNIKKIDKLFNDIIKISEIDTEFNKTITLDITLRDNEDGGGIKLENYDEYIGEKFNNLSRRLIIHCTNKDKTEAPHSPESMRYKSQLNNKLTEIKKFQNKLEDNYRDKFSKIEKDIKGLYAPIEELIIKIKNQPEIHDYPYVKEIYKLYIKDTDNNKDDEEKKHIMYDVNEYFKEYIKNLDDYKSKLDDIIEGKTGKIPYLIKNLDDIILSNKQQRNNNNNGNTYNVGGNNNNIKIKRGGDKTNIDEIEAKFKKILEERAKKINNISKNLKKLKENRNIDTNVEKKLAASDIFDANGNNIFERLITSYENDLNDKTMPDEIAKNLFYNKVKNNNLDPEIELDITLNDKLIFIAIVYSIRFTSLLFCEYLITHNLITDINKSLFYYLIFYYVIFGSLLLIINIDTFKLRILVNYMNLHISTTNIWMHLILMGCFVYLIYLLVVNILGEEKAPTELGDHEKIKLKYKLDLLTIIIYVFICILIFII